MHDDWLVTMLAAVRSTDVVVHRFKFMTTSLAGVYPIYTKPTFSTNFRPAFASTREMEFPKSLEPIVLSIPLHAGPNVNVSH